MGVDRGMFDGLFTMLLIVGAIIGIALWLVGSWLWSHLSIAWV